MNIIRDLFDIARNPSKQTHDESRCGNILLSAVWAISIFVLFQWIVIFEDRQRINDLESKLEQAQADSKAAYQKALWTSSLLSDNMDAIGKEIRNINKQTGMRLWGWQ